VTRSCRCLCAFSCAASPCKLVRWRSAVRLEGSPSAFGECPLQNAAGELANIGFGASRCRHMGFNKPEGISQSSAPSLALDRRPKSQSRRAPVRIPHRSAHGAPKMDWLSSALCQQNHQVQHLCGCQQRCLDLSPEGDGPVPRNIGWSKSGARPFPTACVGMHGGCRARPDSVWKGRSGDKPPTDGLQETPPTGYSLRPCTGRLHHRLHGASSTQAV
jgi:hypothetical protein